MTLKDLKILYIRLSNFNMDNPSHTHETGEFGVKKFMYLNAVFLMQSIVSLFGLGFTASMLIVGRDPATYLPILTGILFFWCPSPMQQKGDKPITLPQVRELLLRSGVHNA
jgi:hypothetical protein